MDLEAAFYILGIVFMSVILLLVVVLLVAALIIRAKIIAFQQKLDDHLAKFTGTLSRSKELFTMLSRAKQAVRKN